MKHVCIRTLSICLILLITSFPVYSAQSSLEYYKKFKNKHVKITLLNDEVIEGRIRDVRKIKSKEDIYDGISKKIRTYETILLELTKSIKLIARTEPRIIINVENILYFEEIKEEKTQ